MSGNGDPEVVAVDSNQEEPLRGAHFNSSIQGVQPGEADSKPYEEVGNQEHMTVPMLQEAGEPDEEGESRPHMESII
jgi:hypothetical protein|tara:strand:- start:279 stop:509 length:231 start_codon:yes stop_codon:yes gene_type:complete